MLDTNLVFWEVEYNDGTIFRESDGNKYSLINRFKLNKFRLITSNSIVLFETWPPPGLSGHNFVYRRRTKMDVGQGQATFFVVGWLGGPAFAIDPASSSYRESREGFTHGDSLLYPPQPMPGELWFDHHEKDFAYQT